MCQKLLIKMAISVIMANSVNPDQTLSTTQMQVEVSALLLDLFGYKMGFSLSSMTTIN